VGGFGRGGLFGFYFYVFLILGSWIFGVLFDFLLLIFNWLVFFLFSWEGLDWFFT